MVLGLLFLSILFSKMWLKLIVVRYCLKTAVLSWTIIKLIWKSCRIVGSDDVRIEITYCGVCYADVIRTRNEHGNSKYPLVPGYVFLYSTILHSFHFSKMVQTVKISAPNFTMIMSYMKVDGPGKRVWLQKKKDCLMEVLNVHIFKLDKDCSVNSTIY